MAPSEDFEAIFGLKRNERGHNYDLTNLDLTGRGGEEIVICADGCCINGGDGGLDMVECLQFVDDFWMWV